MADRHIYGLYYSVPEGGKRYFYVGRSIDPARRMKQHAHGVRKRHEDVYEFLRELATIGANWHHEILDTVTEAAWWPDAERWHVIRLIRAGHELKNMRHGSIVSLVELAKVDPELAEQIEATHIRSAADVRADRERREAERRHLRYIKSRRLQRKVRLAALKRALKEGISDAVNAPDLPPVFRRKLAALHKLDDKKGLVRIDPDFSLPEFVSFIRRPLSGWRQVRELRNRIEQSRSKAQI